MRPGLRYCLTLRNDRAEIGRMAEWVDGILADLALPQRAAYALRLCLEEAVTNIISHAFEPDTTHDIQIGVWRDDAAVHAEISDDGRAFDPLTHQEREAPANLESAEIGGLGIKLMRGFAGVISHRRDGAMNQLVLSFPLPESPSAA